MAGDGLGWLKIFRDGKDDRAPSNQCCGIDRLAHVGAFLFLHFSDLVDKPPKVILGHAE